MKSRYFRLSAIVFLFAGLCSFLVGCSSSDFLMFLRCVQRTPKLPIKKDEPPILMIEFDVKYSHYQYVIPDWMKPYENTPLEEIFGSK